MELTETFHWQGREIACATAGSGPAVVFCHGTPFSSRVWHPFAQALTGDHRVHIWDMPGYGRSSKNPRHPVDFDSQAQALAALLDHWELDRPHVVAHDFGGAVSLRAHLVHGHAYASLLLVDVVAIPPSGSPFFRFVQDNPDVLPGLPGYIHEALVRRYIQNASHRGLRDEDLDALAAPWIGDEGQPAFYRQIEHYDERYLRDNEQRLGDINIPVRVVWAEEDGWIPPDRAHKLAALIPGATVGFVEGAGHLIHYDAPVPLMDELRRWLTAVSGS